MRGGARTVNVDSKLTRAEFIKKLEERGFTRSVSKDGKSTIYTKGTRSYSFYDKSSSGGEPSALLLDGSDRLKIRFLPGK